MICGIRTRSTTEDKRCEIPFTSNWNNLQGDGIRLMDILESLLESNPIDSTVIVSPAKPDDHRHQKRGLQCLRQTTEDIITEHIVDCDNKTCHNKQTSHQTSPNRAIMLLGNTSRSRILEHEQLESDYWKLKLDLLGIRDIPKPITCSSEKSIVTSSALRSCKPSPTPSSDKSSDHFQNYLNLMQLHPGTRSAPPGGRKNRTCDVRVTRPKRKV